MRTVPVGRLSFSSGKTFKPLGNINGHLAVIKGASGVEKIVGHVPKGRYKVRLIGETGRRISSRIERGELELCYCGKVRKFRRIVRYNKRDSTIVVVKEVKATANSIDTAIPH